MTLAVVFLGDAGCSGQSAPRDAATDGPRDVSFDAMADAGPTPTDVATDLTSDVAVDTAADTATDVATDIFTDGVTDGAADGAADVVADARPAHPVMLPSGEGCDLPVVIPDSGTSCGQCYAPDGGPGECALCPTGPDGGLVPLC